MGLSLARRGRPCPDGIIELLEHFGNGGVVQHELEHAVVGARGQHGVRRQAHVRVHLAQQAVQCVHQISYLWLAMDSERQQTGTQRRLEHGARLRGQCRSRESRIAAASRAVSRSAVNVQTVSMQRAPQRLLLVFGPALDGIDCVGQCNHLRDELCLALVLLSKGGRLMLGLGLHL